MGAEIKGVIGLVVQFLIFFVGCVGIVRMYLLSKKLAPEEIGKEPVHSEQVSAWLGHRPFSWQYARLTTYEGFFVLCSWGEQFVFTKENVVSIEPELRRRYQALRISHSLRSAPRKILIRASLVEQLREILWAALDARMLGE